jgi:hypothetical protein
VAGDAREKKGRRGVSNANQKAALRDLQDICFER